QLRRPQKPFRCQAWASSCDVEFGFFGIKVEGTVPTHKARPNHLSVYRLTLHGRFGGDCKLRSCELKQAGTALDAAQAAVQAQAQTACGADPPTFSKMVRQQAATAAAETALEAAQAAYRDALKQYNDAVADLVKAALDARLDR